MGKSRKRQSGEALSDSELRRYIIFLIVFCVVLILIAVMVLSGRKRNSDIETIETISVEPNIAQQTGIPVIEPDTKEYIQDFGVSILLQDVVPEITELMNQYFNAVSACDMETFMHLFTSRDTSQTEEFRKRFEKEKEYIEGYQNISCYTTKGLDENSYAAYVYYETKFIGVETPGPALVLVYAVKCEDGQYRIYDETVSPELEEYLAQVSMNEDVHLLVAQVDRQLTEAMEADAELKSRIGYLEEGPDYMREETQSASE